MMNPTLEARLANAKDREDYLRILIEWGEQQKAIHEAGEDD